MFLSWLNLQILCENRDQRDQREGKHTWTHFAVTSKEELLGVVGIK